MEGADFHGEFASNDASALSEANARFTLYPPGSTSAITLNADDEVFITDIGGGLGTTTILTVYDGADNAAGAGEVGFKGQIAANTPIMLQFLTPIRCQKGTYPKVATAAASVISLQIKGSIRRKGT